MTCVRAATSRFVVYGGKHKKPAGKFRRDVDRDEPSTEQLECGFVEQYERAVEDKFVIHYGDLNNTIKYDNRYKNPIRLTCHNGQRKLLLNEIQFLEYYLNVGKPNIVVYIGSAPGEHLTLIKELFPNNKYLLIDPNYQIIDDDIVYVYQNSDVISTNAKKLYDVYANSPIEHRRRAAKKLKRSKFLYGGEFDALDHQTNRSMVDEQMKLFGDVHHVNLFDDIVGSSEFDIFVIQDYMTIELAKRLSVGMGSFTGDNEVVFISDIRTNLFSEIGPVDLDILYNDAIQIVALDYLKPAWAMLKFHTPYECDQSDVMKFDNSDMRDMIAPYFDKYKEITGRDIIDEYKNGQLYHYKNSVILLQPWAPKASTEARMVISRKDIVEKNIQQYDKSEWEDKYVYLNTYRTMYYNDLYTVNGAAAYDYCGCLDCMIEQTIIFIYYTKYIKGGEIDPLKLSYDAIKSALTPEFFEYLGKFYKKINAHTGYDLGKKTSKKCAIHGWNDRRRANKYFFRAGGQLLEYDGACNSARHNIQGSATDEINIMKNVVRLVRQSD